MGDNSITLRNKKRERSRHELDREIHSARVSPESERRVSADGEPRASADGAPRISTESDPRISASRDACLAGDGANQQQGVEGHAASRDTDYHVDARASSHAMFEGALDPWNRPMISTPLRLPTWVPEDVRDDIRRGLPEGLTKYGSEPPIVAWVRRSGGLTEAEVFQYFPEDAAAYLDRCGGDADMARLLAKTMTSWNRAMRHFTEVLGWSPAEARAEIRRIDEDVFKLSLLAASMMVGAGADLAAIGSAIARRADGHVRVREREVPAERTIEEEAAEVASIELREAPGIAPPVSRRSADRGALEQGGFAHGMKPEEITALHEKLGGPGRLNGHPSSAIAAASRQDGFWNKCSAIVREIAGRHMFRDLNKRTALAVVRELMERNGIRSGVGEREMFFIIDDVAAGRIDDIETIAARLRGF